MQELHVLEPGTAEGVLPVHNITSQPYICMQDFNSHKECDWFLTGFLLEKQPFQRITGTLSEGAYTQ